MWSASGWRTRSRPVDLPRRGRPLAPLLLLPVLAGAGFGVRAGGLAGDPPPIPALPSTDSTLVWVYFEPQLWSTPAPETIVREVGGSVRTRSHWLGALSIALPRGQVGVLSAAEGVRDVRPVLRLPSFSGAPPLASADSTYGSLGEFLDRIGVPQAHAMGFRGSGTRIGILDGLFLPEHATLSSHPPLATRDFVEGDLSVSPSPSDPPLAAAHGTALWSLVSGDLPGVLIGSAPSSAVVLARIRGEGDLTAVDEDRWVAGLEWLESQGVRVVVSGVTFRTFPDFSYGIEDLNGSGTPSSRAADEAARRGVLVVVPMGNRGPGPSTLGAPADADSVLSVGAVDAGGGVAAFSGSGPTGDGRQKPDLLAPGSGLAAASVANAGMLEVVDGTEYAAGLLAGAAALFIEAHPERGPMEVLSALRASVAPGASTFVDVPDVSSAILFPDGFIASPLAELDGEGRVTTLTPEFRWNAPTIHPVGLPVTFLLEFAEDSLFSHVVQRDSVVGTFARRLRAPLPPRSRLFWRIVAVSVQGVRRPTPAQGPVEVPPWVTLDVLNDVGGTEVADPQPELRWTPLEIQPPAGPFIFKVQVLSDRQGELIQSYPGLRENHFRLPEALPFNQPLRWRVIAEARGGQVDTVTSAGSFIVTGETRPPVTILYQNFPNPFPRPDLGSWGTRIWFDLAEEAPVQLTLYDVRGRLVRRLIPGPGCPAQELPPGLYGRGEGPSSNPCVSFSWDGRNDNGAEVPRGVYLLRLRAGSVVKVRRVVYWP